MAFAETRRPAGKPGADGFGFVTDKNSCKKFGAKIFGFWGGYPGYKIYSRYAMTKQLVAKKNSVCVCVCHLQLDFLLMGVGGWHPLNLENFGVGAGGLESKVVTLGFCCWMPEVRFVTFI